MADIRIINTADEFTKLERVWDDLLSQSPANNYFLRWEWLWNWWQVYSNKGDKLSIFVLYNGNEITGIAPFYVRNKLIGGIYPVRRLMFLGTQENDEGDVCSDYLDIIYKNSAENEFVNRILTFIINNDFCDEIYISKMDNSSKTFDLIKNESGNYNLLEIVPNEFISPYITLPSTWDEYLNSLSASMRYKIRNERRKLQKCTNITFKIAQNEADMKAGFEELIRLHEKRWESRGLKGAFSNHKFTMFHNRIMPEMIKKGHLEIVLLLENNQPRAVVYNISYKNKIYFYQSGIDTTARKFAFGYLLHAYCIEEAIKRGFDEYDFLPKGGMDDYKDRFANNFKKVSDIYIARNRLVKSFVRAKESARFMYHRIKPYLKSAK
jgi:CelD/BcsL family acetyltransferase involved in cellulose biosynthesis